MVLVEELELTKEKVDVARHNRKAKGDNMIGYFIIPLWILGQIATTVFLVVTFIMSKVKKSKGGKPYFKIRSIASI